MKYTEEQLRIGAEKAFILNLIVNKFPKGIISYVADSFDIWSVLTKILPTIKKEILARDGKLVIRPDSGDPVDILCGTRKAAKSYDWLVKNIPGIDYENWSYKEDGEYFIHHATEGNKKLSEVNSTPEQKGVIELLWDVFGGTINEQGFKVLDSHIGAIYGDSITLERAEHINARLAEKGFASTNWVAGVGSYSMGYATRDNQGSAVKATYCEITNEIQVGTTPENLKWDTEVIGREIYKDPVTDDGTKKSAKGLLKVVKENDVITLQDQVSWEEESEGLLTPVFLDGKFLKSVTLDEIRERLNKQI